MLINYVSKYGEPFTARRDLSLRAFHTLNVSLTSFLSSLILIIIKSFLVDKPIKSKLPSASAARMPSSSSMRENPRTSTQAHRPKQGPAGQQAKADLRGSAEVLRNQFR